jgi:hypothetical protein
MGLIKTAIMSGAAMYGVKQISKTAQHCSSNSNNNNNNGGGSSGSGSRSGAPSVSYDQQYYPRDNDYPRGPHPRQLRDRDPAPPRYSAQDDCYDLPQSRHTLNQPRRSIDQSAVYNNDNNNGAYVLNDDQQQTRYISSGQENPQFAGVRHQQRGYMEPDEVMEEPRRSRTTGGMMEMMSMLSEQVPGMSAMVQGHNGRGKGSKLSRIFED